MEEQTFLREEEVKFKRLYRFSLWWVEHRASLRRIAYGLFLLLDLIFFLFVGWTFLDSFGVSFARDEREVAKLAVYGQQDLHAYTLANRAADLLSETIRVFPLGNGRYDFYTELGNPNEDWWVEFDYRFLYESERTPVAKGFLLPGQTKPMIALAVNAQRSISDAQLEVTNVSWHRVNRHVIPDYQAWEQDRLDIQILNPSFAQESGFKNDTFGRTTFTVRNQTAFSYVDVSFYVLLKRGAAVVGINRATVAFLGAGEEEQITLNWFGILPSVSSVEVIPDVHLFQPDVYQLP